MKKKIIYILVFLVLVSLVSAVSFNLKLKRNSKELVTCGDFSCDTDWVGFQDNFNWTYDDEFDRARHITDNPDEPANNLSQTLSIKQNTRYNVIMNTSFVPGRGGLVNFSVYLGGVRGFFNSTDVSINKEIFSFEVTTINTDDLIFEAYTLNAIGGGSSIWSISVKEIKKKFKWKLKTKNNDGIFRWKLKRS